MIAVRALYRGSKIEFLEPPPTLAQTPVIVVFLEAEGVEDVLAPYAEQMAATNWGEPMDSEGARLLVALHEELTPYRTETNQIADQELEA